MSGNLKTAAEIETEIRFDGKFLVRLRQSFQLEKEYALEEGGDALRLFRERSRTYYQPVALRMQNDFRRLRYRMSKVDNIPESIFLRLDALEKVVKEIRAHFAGAPNRLIRNSEQNTGDD
ncbi:MAG: hypothetical protein J7K88_08115 [Candidatus Fermentibacteraceae bacterium]|nr:hypothetical protein [Candidatus Fermentibacteraceae bacterium]